MHATENLHLPLGPSLNELFVLTIDGVSYLGRKRANAQGQTSSCLAPSMLLGRLLSARWMDQGLRCQFSNLSEQASRVLFRQAQGAAQSDIHFPFPLVDDRGQEQISPAAFWDDTERLAGVLDSQETHFRQRCIEYLRLHVAKDAVIYDPACSTGTFIGALAHALPDAVCIGTDLSARMIEHARHHNPQPNLGFQVADAQSPVMAAASCDVLVLRFLNAEVMPRQQAVALFHRLIRLIKPGGVIILFGHTPVLFAVPAEAARAGLRVLRSLGCIPGSDELFQFYLLEHHAS
jgi:isonocardicin synthase